MKAKLFQNKICVKKSLIQGYGVFAEERIDAGSVVEECYTLFTKHNPIFDYTFSADDLIALPLGYGAIYNHAITPNVEYHFCVKTKVMVLTALRTIQAGEELLINYGENWFSERNLTFRKVSWWRQIYHSTIFRGLLITLLGAGFIFILKYTLINGDMPAPIVKLLKLAR